MEQIVLEAEQEELLKDMVEAVRNVPPENRQKFLLIRALGGKDTLHHPGLPGTNLEIYHGDLEILAEYGLLTVTLSGRNSRNYDVYPRGFRYYEQMQQQSGEPTDQVEQEVHRYLDARHSGTAIQLPIESGTMLRANCGGQSLKSNFPL